MKKVAMVLGATLVVVGIAAIYLWQELRTQREQNTTAMARVTALESAHSKGSVVAELIADAAQAATLNSATVARTEPAAAAPAARGPSAAGNGNSLRAQMELMQSNPQFQEMQRMMMRQMMEQEYPDLAKDFHLSKEKAGKLLDLLVKQQMDMVADSMGELRGGKQDRAARAEQARIRDEKERAFEADMKALLGDDYAKWDDYENAVSERQRQEYAREQKEELRHAITADGATLTDPQFEQLNAAITAEQKRIDEEPGATSMKQRLERMPEINRRLLAVAAPHLNPQQLDRYKRFLEQQQEMVSAVEAMGAFPDD